MSRLIDSFDAFVRGAPRAFLTLLITVFFADLALGIQTAAYSNLMVEELSIRPEQLGVLESVRELPGLLLVGIAALTAHVPEPLVAGGALLLEAIGITSVYFVSSVQMIVLISFTWSLGLHTWMPINQSIALAAAEDDRQGKRLGQMRSVTALSNLVGMGLVAIVAPMVGLRGVFLIAGASLGIAALNVLRVPRELRGVERPRLVFRRRYLLYYGLTFLDGCRRQVFITFAVFALVQVYGTSVSQVALLMVVTNLANLFLAPAVGRLIDRRGERSILTANYLLLVVIFIGYGLVTSREALFALYAADGVVFTLSIALTTYIGRIADRRDLTPTLSMGVTANHIAAVIVPVSGGLLWATYGYQVFFFAGAAIALVSLAVTQLLPGRIAAETVATAEG